MFQKTASIWHSETLDHLMWWLADSYWVRVWYLTFWTVSLSREKQQEIFLHRGRRFFHTLMRKQDSNYTFAVASTCRTWTLMPKATRIKWFLKAETGTPSSILIFSDGGAIGVAVAGSGWQDTACYGHSRCRWARHGCCNSAPLTSSPYLPAQHPQRQRGKAATSGHKQAQKSVGKNTKPSSTLNLVFLNKKDLYRGAFFLL